MKAEASARLHCQGVLGSLAGSADNEDALPSLGLSVARVIWK
jgi:hypothetical protein